MQDINSIGTRRGISNALIPFGRKNPKNWNLCREKAIKFIPIKNVSAKLNVTEMWLVIVKE